MKTIRRLAPVVVLPAALVSCGRGKAREKPARPVRVETVTAETAAGGLRYSATIQPYEQVSLAFKVNGYVREIQQRKGPDGRPRRLQQGDEVEPGSVLARVNDADYRERVNQARAQVAQAEANLGKARADAERTERLYQGKSLTRPDYDAAQAAFAAAAASAEGARAQLADAEIALRDCALVAPARAVVLSRNVEVGTLAAAGTAGFVLADLSRVKAVFGVPDRLVQRVKPGMSLPVTSDTFVGVQFPGSVTAVSPSADSQTRVFSVEVTIPNPSRQLKAGMIATVEVAPPTSPEIPAGQPTVSLAAVVKSAREAGEYAVFVAEGGEDRATARARDVSLGAISGNRVAVTTGLKAGEKVIVTGASLLTDGEAVRVIPGSEED